MCSFRFVYYFGYSPWFTRFQCGSDHECQYRFTEGDFSGPFLARGMGINGLIIAVAAAAGPTVAAGILAIADWPWLFAINVPIGLVAFVLSLKFYRNPVKVEGQRFDVTSAVMNALTFGLLICVIDGFAHDIHWYILIRVLLSC